MRNGETRKGADYTSENKAWLNAADAQLLLHLLEHRSDLAHRLADLLFLGFQGARPEAQRFGVFGVDFRRVRGIVLGHGSETAAAL